MKTLLLMRHAKSSWDDTSLDDHDRPLNTRGQRDVPRMAALLRAENLIPERIVCSSAVRAQSTANIVASECALIDRLNITSDLYHAAVEDWQKVVHRLDPQDDQVLCIGHNPGIEEFVATSVGKFVGMPTSAIAHLRFDVGHWQEITASGDAALIAVWRPKELPDV